jgi:hypothetical protein
VAADVPVRAARVAHRARGRRRRARPRGRAVGTGAPLAGRRRSRSRSSAQRRPRRRQHARGGLASLGAITLVGEGIATGVVVANLPACFAGGRCLDGPPEELTWTALGLLGGGILLAVIGLVVDAALPARDTARVPISLSAGELRF